MIMRLSNMRVRSGFTLAEVLITLGIIGVVAAMTMPTLMNSTQGAQYKAAYKKALSALSQAVTLNMALDEWNFADLSANGEGDNKAADGTYNMANMLKARMNVVREETGWDNIKVSNGSAYSVGAGGATGSDTVSLDQGNVTLFFNDGIMFSFPAFSENCTRGADGTAALNTIDGSCKGFIDVNGVKAPNKLVKCDNTNATEDNCQIKSPTDVYPVIFYDQTVMPNSIPARAVLYSK